MLDRSSNDLLPLVLPRSQSLGQIFCEHRDRPGAALDDEDGGLPVPEQLVVGRVVGPLGGGVV